MGPGPVPRERHGHLSGVLGFMFEEQSRVAHLTMGLLAILYARPSLEGRDGRQASVHEA